ncbi:MAG: hypothetical protein Q8P20_00260 [bacterium]|nr:hypothetical protein [bacterium]
MFKIFRLASRFEKFATGPSSEDYEPIPPTQPEGEDEEDAPSTEKPLSPEEIERMLELYQHNKPKEEDGPATERTGPPAQLTKGNGEQYMITIDSTLIAVAVRYLEHKMKKDIEFYERNGNDVPDNTIAHLQRLRKFIAQLQSGAPMSSAEPSLATI